MIGRITVIGVGPENAATKEKNNVFEVCLRGWPSGSLEADQ